MGDATDPQPSETVLPKQTWASLLGKYPEVKFVWIRFSPVLGGLLAYMVPVQRFSRMIEDGQKCSVGTFNLTHSGHDNSMASDVPFCGSLYLEPDLQAVFPWFHMTSGAPRLEVFTRTLNEHGDPAVECPRTNLKGLEQKLAQQYQSNILVGVEVEVIFIRNSDRDGLDPLDQSIVHRSHVFAGATAAMKRTTVAMVEEIVTKALDMGIEIDRYHAEMTPGQWEFSLLPQTPVQAIDMLLQFREVLEIIAREHGFMATMHPEPFSGRLGSGVHMHISWNSPVGAEQADDRETAQAESFFAGMIEHLPAIVGVAAPLDVSFQRLKRLCVDDVFWGWNNRYAPLRRITSNRFEFRLMCGTANPYLVLASILAAGSDGLHRGVNLRAGPCQFPSVDLSEDDRSDLGIVAKIPRDIEEATESLRRDVVLATYLGQPLVQAYLHSIVSYNQRLRQMNPAEQSRFLIEIY
ncbi:FluG family protein [Penicillium cosmopolitanum]|uniref:FluG family protein n=1 Tax=Penicillium cosmopolitanum TaxID=1131564 RepID=A0A9W9W9Y0_9EURO|nr:FluG family protein [Penicillium cosmopolitanum]KAJ5413635.1 FluG family protein [Penicillium cosmopolitanum]